MEESSSTIEDLLELAKSEDRCHRIVAVVHAQSLLERALRTSASHGGSTKRDTIRAAEAAGYLEFTRELEIALRTRDRCAHERHFPDAAEAVQAVRAFGAALGSLATTCHVIGCSNRGQVRCAGCTRWLCAAHLPTDECALCGMTICSACLSSLQHDYDSFHCDYCDRAYCKKCAGKQRIKNWVYKDQEGFVRECDPCKMKREGRDPTVESSRRPDADPTRRSVFAGPPLGVRRNVPLEHPAPPADPGFRRKVH